MTTTTNLGLPIVEASQSQKHIPVNESFEVLDDIVQLSVVSASTTTPPGSPSDGQRWIIPNGATGIWAGKQTQIATWKNGAWRYYSPKTGWRAFNQQTSTLLLFNGSNWVSALTGEVNLSALGINTTPDANNNKLAVKANGILFSHDDVTPGSGDMRVTINKSAAGKDASLVFQNNWSTRALLGLLANDDLTIKVSPDGSNWKNGLIIDRNTGAVHLPENPKFSAYLNWAGGQPVGADGWTKVGFNFARHNDQNSFDTVTYGFTVPVDGCYLFGANFKFLSTGINPSLIRLGISVNFAVPYDDTIVTAVPDTDPSNTILQTTALLWLEAGDEVFALTYYTGSGGKVEDFQNHFWGIKVA